MITGIFGAIGSGKSWLQLKYALEECNKKQKRLVSNFFLNLDELYSYCLIRKFTHVIEEINKGGIIYINSNQSLASLLSIPRSVVCLDEAGVFLNSRQFQSTPKELLNDLCQSRKDGIDLIYAAQFTKQVDAQIRALTQFVYHCRGSTIYNYKAARPELIIKNFHLFEADTYDQWVMSRSKNNPMKTRFAYASNSQTGPLSIIDQDLFKVFDSLSRLDRQKADKLKYSRGFYEPIEYQYMKAIKADYDGEKIPTVKLEQGQNLADFLNSIEHLENCLEESDNGLMKAAEKQPDHQNLNESVTLSSAVGLFADIMPTEKSRQQEDKTIWETCLLLISRGKYEPHKRESLALKIYRFLGNLLPATSRNGVLKICRLVQKLYKN